MSSRLTSEHLLRGALVYVRQSTQRQVREHTEGRRRQYELVESARELGFVSVSVIDDDLGKSGSGFQERPGFQKLVAAVCAGTVGGVFCLEASRLARNGRDWHHLIDLCALVGVLVFDPDGVYDPRLMNDRLLLGLKGSMSEYELGLLRQRSLEARNTKAARGELRFRLAAGYVWTDGSIVKDPDARVSDAIAMAFKKYAELGSARQAWLWYKLEEVELPVLSRHGSELRWCVPAYHNLLTLLRNPLYAGAYAFGRTGKRTTVRDGRARQSNGHKKPMDDWSVLLHDHHEGYIGWEQFLGHQAMLNDNAHMKKRAQRKAGRGGRALLTGMVRCARCGFMMRVTYSSKAGTSHRYFCRSRDFKNPDQPCIGVGGVTMDRAIAARMMEALSPEAIDAAELAVLHAQERAEDTLNATRRELEEAQYEARLAARRYEAVDPDKRLVASELEARWETALQRAASLEGRLEARSHTEEVGCLPDISQLRTLARRLPEVWNAPTADTKLKQRVAQILIREVVLDVDVETCESVAIVHWTGGQHTEVRVRRRRGLKVTRPPLDGGEVVRQMAERYTDGEIALTLNRARRGTRTPGSTWSQLRVRQLRESLGLPQHDPTVPRPATVSRDEAAIRLGVCVGSVKRLIDDGILPAQQVAPFAPWQIPEAALTNEKVVAGVKAVEARRPRKSADYRASTVLQLPGLD